MSRLWATTSSTHVESVVNPLAAACTNGFIPDTVYFLDNPGVTDQLDRTIELTRAIITAHGGDDPTIETTSLEHETEYRDIVEHFKTAIQAAPTDAEVAVDVTPGRKFMSAIAFQAGIQYDVDHVFYLYLASEAYFGRLYPTIPRTATELVDFTAVFGDA